MTFFSISLSRGQQFKLVLFGALAIGVLATMAGRGTLAYFSTSVGSTANQFSAGDLHFRITDNNQGPTATSDTTSGTVAASITLANLKPGDTVFAPITITNGGTLDAQWGIKFTEAAVPTYTDLAPALQMGIVGRGSVGGTVAADCTAANFADNTVWAEQILPMPGSTTPNLSTMPGTIANYQAATGPGGVTDESGDGAYGAADYAAHRYLPLTHGTADVLCVQVKFPDNGLPANPDDKTSGDNTWNGPNAATYGTIVAFTFDGRQRHLNVETDQPSGPTTPTF